MIECTLFRIRQSFTASRHTIEFHQNIDFFNILNEIMYKKFLYARFFFHTVHPSLRQFRWHAYQNNEKFNIDFVSLCLIILDFPIFL